MTFTEKGRRWNTLKTHQQFKNWQKYFNEGHNMFREKYGKLFLNYPCLVCILILVATFPEWFSGTEPLPHTPCVRPRCVYSVLRAHAQFCRFDKADATPTFSDTAITDCQSYTTIFQLRAHWVRIHWISWSIGSEKSFGHVPQVGIEPSTSCVQGEHPIH